VAAEVGANEYPLTASLQTPPDKKAVTTHLPPALSTTEDTPAPLPTALESSANCHVCYLYPLL
jgi:nitrous oxide reductase accessory protein NosL